LCLRERRPWSTGLDKIPRLYIVILCVDKSVACGEGILPGCVCSQVVEQVVLASSDRANRQFDETMKLFANALYL
jgi:hypothetical protein